MPTVFEQAQQNPTHMPFLVEHAGQSTLLFCRSDETFKHSSGAILRKWQLSLTDWNDESAPTENLPGLGPEFIHCSPTAYVDAIGNLHVSFVAGDSRQPVIDYRLYTMHGPDIRSLSEPLLEPSHGWPVWTAFRSPAGAMFSPARTGTQMVPIRVALADGRTSVIEVGLPAVHRISFDPRDANRLVICASDTGGTIHTLLFDFAKGAVLGELPAEVGYKAAILGDEVVHAYRNDAAGFEDRILHWEASYTLTPTSVTVTRIK